LLGRVRRIFDEARKSHRHSRDHRQSHVNVPSKRTLRNDRRFRHLGRRNKS
jgi:hypothetical protein